MNNKFIIDGDKPGSMFEMKNALSATITPFCSEDRKIVFLCIGTDRSTGDSLGPLTGEKLSKVLLNKYPVYGNLENPVHAKNLKEVLHFLKSSYSNPFIVAIDACLGSLQNIGKVIVQDKPLFPGSAMSKDLPPVGDVSITGIVNISGNLEFMVLQNTRLFTVVKLSEIISNGIYSWALSNKPKNYIDYVDM